MNQEQLKNIVEAALMVSEKPVSVGQLLTLFENETDRPEKADIKTVIEQIMQDYEAHVLFSDLGNGDIHNIQVLTFDQI